MTNIQDVIKRAAIECHMGLKEDDPVMSLVTVINQITEDQEKVFQASLEQYREQHEDIAHRWRQDAESVAKRIIHAALNAGQETLGKGMSEGAAQVIALIRQENAHAVAIQKAELRQAIHDFRRLAAWMFAGNAALLFLMVLFVILSR